MKTIVVIPTYDEKDNVAPMAKAVLATAGVEILFVDDNSPDGTGDCIEEMMKTEPRIHCLHRTKKEGLGRAYVAGFQKALELGAEKIVQMDCDFSHDPKDLPRMIAEDADLVIGSRYVKDGSTPGWPFKRRLISRAGGIFIRLVTGMPLRDPTGGFKCWKASTLKTIDFTTVGSKGYSFQLEMNHRTWKAGCTIHEIPIVFTDRVEGYSKITPGIATESIKIALKLRFGTFLLAAALTALACGAGEAKTPPRKVLMIGNSFSASVMRETPKLAAAEGLALDIVQCGIGGCPFERHWANVEKAADASFKPYSVHASYASEPARKMPKHVNLPEILTNDLWDVVTIQQASGQSPFIEKYHPFADNLIAKIRELAPQAEIVIQETWSYAPYDTRLVKDWKWTPAEMYEKVKAAYASLATQYAFRTIPTGDAVQLFRERLPVSYGKLLTRAEIAALQEPATVDFHGDVCGRSSWGQGRKDRDPDWQRIRLVNDFPHLNARGHYLQACVWLAKLFGVDPTTFSHKPDSLTDAEAKLMRECARDAVNLPLETARWQAEIDRAAAAGGGTVTIPAGWHRTGSLHLKSGVTLELAKGCVLEGSPNIADYDDMTFTYAEIAAPWQAIIEVDGQHDVAVVGEGTLFGGGRAFPYHVRLGRPRGLLFNRCRNVRVEGIRIVDPASWTCYFKECDGVVYRRVTVDAHGNGNNDGVDIDSRNVLVENCTIDSQDDGVCLKSDNPGFICENVEVRNCEVRSECNLLKLGTGSHGGFRNISFHDCVVGKTRRIVRDPKLKKGEKTSIERNLPGAKGVQPISGISVESVDGALTENISFRNIEIEAACTPIFIRAGLRPDRGCGIPVGTGRTLRNVTIENVRAKATSFTSSSITGVPEQRVKGVTLRNVAIEVPGAGEAGLAELGKPVPEHVSGYPEACMFDSRILPSYGFYLRHVDGLVFDNVTVRVLGQEHRPEVVTDDVTDFTRTGSRVVSD